MPVRTLALLTAAVLGLAACSPSGGIRSSGIADTCQTRAGADIGGPFTLTDHTGARVTEADYAGEPVLVFFGFTYCPDVCPFTLYKIDQAFDFLPDGMNPPKTMIISIDPERDTPELLATFVTNEGFPSDLVGLTGTPEEIKATAAEFFAAYSRIEDPSSTAGYTMDHSSLIYLMDENWDLKTFFTHEATSEAIGNCLATHLS